MNHPAVLIDPAPRTFFGVPSARNLEMLDAQVAFLGVPYDGGTPQPGIPTGQRAGPAAAREATVDQFYYPRLADAGDDQGAEGWYDVEADRDYLVGVRMADVGDVAIQGSEKVRRWKRFRFPKVTVRFGEPLSFPTEEAPSRERQLEVAEQIFSPVREMYAGLTTRSGR